MSASFTHASAGVEQARRQLPAILAAAAAGTVTVITRHGREVAAMIVPVAAARLPGPAPLTALAGTGRGLWTSHSAHTIARVRDEWNRQTSP